LLRRLPAPRNDNLEPSLRAKRSNLASWWSRRITGDHRIRGSGAEQRLEIVACRYHYSPRR
jgi:Txe/YoeB family toxin of Txe-Axe toxin-antitoxin module